MSAVPENITIIRTKKHKKILSIDGKTHTDTVIPVFVADSESKGSIETGKRWANGYGRSGIVERPNKPFTNLKVYECEERGEGGRAWKVSDEEGYYFDMREDIFLESMYAGELKGMTLKGKYVWIKNGTQMKVVRAGSENHKEAQAYAARDNLKKIPNKDLVPGGIYATKSQMANLVLGHVKGKGVILMETAGKYAQRDFDQLIASGNGDWMLKVQKTTSFVEKIADVDLHDMDKLDPMVQKVIKRNEDAAASWKKYRQEEKAREDKIVETAKKMPKWGIYQIASHLSLHSQKIGDALFKAGFRRDY